MDDIKFKKWMKEILEVLYPDENDSSLIERIFDTLLAYRTNRVILEKREKYRDKISLSEEDSILMTYGDTLFEKGEKPLRTLHRFLKTHIKSSFTTVHILPFFLSSSDGGFAVIDYGSVEPGLGDWDDIEAIAKDYRLMADLVLNHCSSRSAWFKGFLAGDSRYQDYFISFDRPVDVSKVFRPREAPLLTRFETAMGPKTDCVNLHQTHEIVKFLRTVAEYAACAIVLLDKGIPGIYIHCLLGSRNNLKGMKETGVKRMINRERLSFEALSRELSDPGTLRNQVVTRLINLLQVRKEIPAFHHAIERDIRHSDKRLFIMERKLGGKSSIVVVNVSDDTVSLPEYKGKLDYMRNIPFDGNVSPYGICFLNY